jgi:membrane associated rhomboid family serine protease
MEDIEFESAPVAERPRTTTVVGLLCAAAAIFSYLGSYAVTNALVAADLLKPWSRDHDPRPLWFVAGFVLLMALFLAIAGMARFLSSRHLRQIEQMEKEE